MDGARLSRLSKDDVDPLMSPCRMGLQLERELGGLIWELPTIGPGALSFLIGACRGSGDKERWDLARGCLIIRSTMPF